jgi:hypothetical protein
MALPDIPSAAPAEPLTAGAGAVGPGAGISPDRGAPGPPPGGDPPGGNVRGAWPGDMDGDETGDGYGADLVTEGLRLR